MKSKPGDIAELRQTGYEPTPVKQELERNLIFAMENGEELFPGIVGYENTVIPQTINAILSHHDIVFLGEKGQAKTRMMRALTRFLDKEIPAIADCEINDNPYDPICLNCRNKIKEEGGDVKIEWIDRDARYGERLAPGTKIADLIGDLDPAKVAGGAPLASEDALHFGLIPRLNRGIFAINELPDLEYLIQVSLFNILEERDVQIRGYPIRFPLDVALVFSANPEEYSRSGKIISQLKDRIGAEIRTHYPLSREVGLKIIDQEAKIEVGAGRTMKAPDFMRDIVEQITMDARVSPHVNQRSGVSARLSITNYETMLANARRRAITLGETEIAPRMSDLNYLYTSSLGKIEMDPFREESLSDVQVITRIMESAVRKVFMERIGQANLDEMVEKIKGDVSVDTGDMAPSADYRNVISRVTQLWEPVHSLGGDESDAMRASCVEFILEGLYLTGKLTRRRIGDMVTYRGRAR